MGRQQKHKEYEMERYIAEYIQSNDGADGIDELRDYVFGKMGTRPSKGFVIGVLEALGVKYQAGRWVRGLN